MAELATIARPYAEAVFKIALETDQFEVWSENLKFLETLLQDSTMDSVIANPKVDKSTLCRLLLDICEGQISETGQNLVKILVDNHRLRAIPQIVIQYELLKAQHQGYLKVDIASPYPIEPLQQQEIETALQKRLGKSVDIHVTIDKSLVGGWLIRAGDQVIDVSILGRLQQLAYELRR